MVQPAHPEILLIGIGLAVLLPVVPFALELLALRRLTTAAFGTLMSLEPAFALVVGMVMPHQMPGPFGVVGICFVVSAGIGAARSGARALPVPAEVGSIPDYPDGNIHRHREIQCNAEYSGRQSSASSTRCS